MSFILSCARLYADICEVKYSTEDLNSDKIMSILESVKVPPFKPTSKVRILNANQFLKKRVQLVY